MSYAFKKYNFFTHSEVHGHAFPRNATCSTPGAGCCFVGCDNGSVQLLDDSFQLLTSFQAHGHKVLELVFTQVSPSTNLCLPPQI